MGSSFCQCKSICHTKREEHLLSTNLSNTFNYNYNNNTRKSRNKFINSLSSFSSTENLNSIYRKNCAQKIIKTYLNYKRNKNDKINENVQKNTYNNEEEINNNSKNSIEPYDNLDKYSINHPFYIDKINKSKTIYQKINIPKINNGKSLESLNINNSNSLIQHKENFINLKKKKIFGIISNDKING